jgi:hypothetical protein
LGTGSADNIRASGILIPAQKAEDMTAPETRTEPKITFDQRPSSRHDGAGGIPHSLEGFGDTSALLVVGSKRREGRSLDFKNGALSISGET